jgi:hypothetical protein
VGIDFDVKDINAGEAFEQHRLALHDGLAGEGANVAQTEYGCAVGHDSDEIAAPGVFESVVRILIYREAWFSHPRRIGQAQITLRTAWFGRSDFNFARMSTEVIIKRLLLCDHIDSSPLLGGLMISCR